jgi:deoxyribodipyrimidine photo-lyase
MSFSCALFWFRRDLRIADNAGLCAALREFKVVWPVFVFDPRILGAADMGAPRVAFLLDCLDSLARNIEACGGALILRRGDPADELLRLARDTRAEAIYWNRDYEPFARERDAKVARQAESAGLKVAAFKDGVIHEPHEVLKGDGTPYAVYSPYSRAWRALPKEKPLPRAKFALPEGEARPASEPLPALAACGFTLAACGLPKGGEKAARERLTRFMSGPVLAYRSQRNFPSINGTSRLSADLRFGTLSPRTVLAAAEKASAEAAPREKGEVEVFVNEIIWREFYRQVLWHHPRVVSEAFKPAFNDIAWENNEAHFKAWCDGRTGYPIVDAAMRQLNATGWMHNRLRMIVAMFLTKDLLVDWKWGERYFMQRLVDGDLASNNGGWQWSAGTGTDAQPYFRIFNPTSQAEKFDPEGRFIERYLPEANSLGYPAPIVDHADQRLKVLKLFKVANEAARDV